MEAKQDRLGWRDWVFAVVAFALTVSAVASIVTDYRAWRESELEEPYSEEQFMNDVFGSAHDPVKCGEVLCSDCDDLVVCYDGGRCPVSGDAHPMTLCSVEHEVK